jgi:hypothetical protein
MVHASYSLLSIATPYCLMFLGTQPLNQVKKGAFLLGGYINRFHIFTLYLVGIHYFHVSFYI